MAATATRCPACDASGASRELTVPDREYGLPTRTHYATCARCASCFQVPMPRVDELAAFYPSDYHSMSGESALARIRHGMRAKRLLGLLPRPGPVLDYGCGDGSFLRALAARAPDGRYVGYEIGDTNEVEAQLDGVVTLVRGDLEHLLAHLPTVALITMNHVIEHLPDPHELLRRLLPSLAPGGVLEGQTPATDSLEHWAFGRRWSGYHAPRHTVIFSSSGLEACLTRAGLEQVRIERAFNPAGLAVSFASLRQGDAGGVIRRQGLGWLLCLGLGTLTAPFDLLTKPGIMNFSARKAEA